MTFPEKIGSRQALIFTFVEIALGYILIVILIKLVVGSQLTDALTWLFHLDIKDYIVIATSLITAVLVARRFGAYAGKRISEKPKIYAWAGILTSLGVTFLSFVASYLVIMVIESKTSLPSYNDMAEDSYVYLIVLLYSMVMMLTPAIPIGYFLGRSIMLKLSKEAN